MVEAVAVYMKRVKSKYCDVHAVGNMACVDNRCYDNG
jgi:hypothetical protein